jgi:hypothetical protein
MPGNPVSLNAVRAVAQARARYADHGTGRNCRPTNERPSVSGKQVVYPLFGAVQPLDPAVESGGIPGGGTQVRYSPSCGAQYLAAADFFILMAHALFLRHEDENSVGKT